MKNWTLFKWAASRLQFKDGHCQKKLKELYSDIPDDYFWRET